MCFQALIFLALIFVDARDTLVLCFRLPGSLLQYESISRQSFQGC